MDKTTLIKIYIDRITAQLGKMKQEPATNVREEFARLNLPVSLNYHLRTGQIDGLPIAYREQAANVVANFGRKQASLFYNKVDFKMTESIFLWTISLFEYAKYSENWNFIKDLYELWKLVFEFYSGTDSLCIKQGPSGTILCRMKDEFPFVKENEVICSSYLNILWIRFLDNLKFLAERFLDIKTDSKVGELLDKLEANFYSLFWDEGMRNIRFSSTESGMSENSTSLSLALFKFRMENLLYKQRKKGLLKMMEEEYYTDKGFLLSYKSKDVLLPELLPVFWSAYLRFHENSRPSLEKVRELILRHVGSIDPQTYDSENWKYNSNMLDFLCVERLDFS